MFSIERVVVLLTPIFGAAAAWFVALIADNVPGAPALNAASVRDVEIAVFVSVCGIVGKWLHGRQKPELLSGRDVAKLGHLAAKTGQIPPQA